jgi:hypothetical protein
LTTTALNYTDVPYTQVPGQTPGVYSGSATFLLLSASTPTSENIWIMKYSIGPGASYDLPWGSPGPRDYYLTGTYSPETNLIEFVRDPIQWDAAMNRSTLLAFDVGAFYASKSVYLPEVGRILWGWIPEERLVDSNGAPYGWAGVMSLPRLIVPYQDTEGSWFVRTPPLQAALDELYLPTSGSSFTKDNLIVSTAPSSPAAGETALAYLDEITGDQLEIVVCPHSSRSESPSS